MSLPAPSVAQIRAQVAKLREDGLDAPVIGLRVGPGTDVGDSLLVGEDRLAVVRCASVLEVHERLLSITVDSAPMVLLTDLSEQELGHDVVVRLAKRKLIAIDPWTLVKHRFKVRHIDPRLVRHHPWLARVLLEAEPSEGYPPAPSGFLPADMVWGLLFDALLGLRGERDAQGLLAWSLDPERRARLAALPGEVRGGLAGAVVESGGAVAGRVFRCLEGAHGDKALAIGLCARVLYDVEAASDATAAKGQGKLESLLGGVDLDPATALAWADAAEAVLRRHLQDAKPGSAAPLLSAADALLASLSATSCAHRSRLLRAGFEQRLARFAEELKTFLASKARVLSPKLAKAASRVFEHELADHDGQDRAARAEMALRLAEWLAEQGALPESKPGSFAEAARRYRCDGGHVDWARAHLRDGDPATSVGKSYSMLAKAVDARRAAQNEAFGTALANWTSTGSHDDAVLPVEKVIDRLVVPLAGAAPVLLVVIDGMSMAVFRELHENLGRQGWLEVTSSTAPTRRPVIAAIPSVTEVSRASLLCGRLVCGDRNLEKQGFATHHGLLAAGDAARPPVLFHKGELVEEGAVGVATAVREAVADPRRRVVGVVINAVDDHLAKGEQVRVDWIARRIRPLSELLDVAREAGRAVVLVSDHGHVLEHHSKRPAESESERWRPGTGDPADGEIRLQGPRVLLGGGNLIAPWSEQIRYSVQKKNGYHGGASPQEMLIPLAVYAPPGAALAGWQEAEPEVPGWWERIDDAAPTPKPPRPRASKPALPEKPGAQGSLFEDSAEAPASPAPAAGDWIAALLASEMMKVQRQATARTALSDERIAAVLAALEERGGKLTRGALAKRLGLPPIRVNGVLSAMRRLLNVDGYAVLAVDEASDTVSLNREYLGVQFEIEG